MQSNKAEELRQQWGNKPCNHPNIEKEYILGGHTGDYVCTTCGKVFSSREEAEREQDELRKRK